MLRFPAALRVSRRIVLVATIAICLLPCVATVPAWCRAVIEVIIIDPASTAASFVPGDSLPLSVTLDDSGSTNVHVYSEPAGAVTYDGPVSGPTDTILATTDPDTPLGSVMIYAIAEDGTQTVSTSVDAVTGDDQPEDDDPMPSGE